MSGNQKQAPTVLPQSHARYNQASYMPRPPTPGRAEAFHVQSQPYVPQQPPNQTGNQGPSLRGMAPTGPPTQASTPPNSDMNKVQQMPPQAPQQVNITYVQRPPYYTRQPQPNQPSRMQQTHRQGQQPPIYQAQTQQQFMQIPVPPVLLNQLYGNQYPNNSQQPRYLQQPNNYMINPSYMHYTTTQPQPQQSFYYHHPLTAIPRQPHPPPVAAAPQSIQSINQQAPPAVTYTPNMQPQTQTMKSKKRPNAIAIIDPITGKNIELEGNQDLNDSSHPPSGESSARQTPQPGGHTSGSSGASNAVTTAAISHHTSKEVQATFAKQVLQLIISDENQQVDEQLPPPPQQQQQQQPPPHPHQVQFPHSNQMAPPSLDLNVAPPLAALVQQPPPPMNVPAATVGMQQAPPPLFEHHPIQHQQHHHIPAQQQHHHVVQQQQHVVVDPSVQYGYIPVAHPAGIPVLPIRPETLVQTSKLQVTTKDFVPAKETTPVVSANRGEEVTLINSKPAKDRDSPAKGGGGGAGPTTTTSSLPNNTSRKHRGSGVEATVPTVAAPVAQPPPVVPVVVAAPAVVTPPQSTVSAEATVATAALVASKQEQVVAPVAAVVASAGGRDSSAVVAGAVPVSNDTSKYREEVSSSITTTVVKNESAAGVEERGINVLVTEEFPPQAQDNAKSKQSSQRTKDVSKQQPQSQQQAPPPQQQPPVQQKPSVVSKAPVAATIPVPQSQPTKANNKTNKIKELNNKGATKEGTDMDAFNDVNAEQQPQEAVAVTTTDSVNSTTTNVLPDNKELTVSATSVISNSIESNKKPEINEMPTTIKTLPKGRVNVCDIVKEIPKPFVAPVESKDEADKAVLSNDNLVQAKNEANKSAPPESNNSEVKNQLPYEKDQWSPYNKEGKRQYGKEFLMALRDDTKCKILPESIKDCGILKDQDKTRMGEHTNRSYGMVGGGRTDFTPAFGGNSYSGKSPSQKGVAMKQRTSLHGKTGGGGGGGSRGSKSGTIKVSISVKEEVKLHESKNAWKPTRPVIGAEATDEDLKTADLYKKMRGILNKLTPQKFDTLVDQVNALTIDTKGRLSGVIDLVFEKAVDEPNFSVAYANLCATIATKQVPNESADKDGDEFVNFRKLLLNRCQMEFEKNSQNEKAREVKLREIEECTDPEKKKELTLIQEEEYRKIRMKSVGNIRFIGELFKQKMLTVKIMNRCIVNMLQDKHEESLECLCKLLTTIGKELDNKNQPDNLSSTFNTMKNIVDRKQGYNISSRVRFMLQDVIDLKASNWVPRRGDFIPKTMDQIAKEAENEHLDIQVMNSMPPPMRNSNSQSDRNKRGGSRSMTNEEGWSPVPPRNNRAAFFSVQCDKLRIKQPQADERLGSMSQFGNWGRGSNIKTTAGNVMPVSTNTKNMYAPLESMEQPSDKMNRINKDRDPYSSKGHSLEKYNKQYDGHGSRSGSRHRSNESSERSTPLQQHNTIPPAKLQPEPAAAPAAQKLPEDPEKLERLLRNALDEYLGDNCSLADLGTELKDFITVDQYNLFVSIGYMQVLEKKEDHRRKTGNLFGQLILANILPIDQYCIGLEEMLSMAPDLTIDIPKIWDYLAQMIGPPICLEALPFSRLLSPCKEVIKFGLAHELLPPLFNLINTEKGPDFLKSNWSKAGVSLSDFMPAGDVDLFVKKHNLEILVGGSELPKVNAVLSFDQIRLKLLEFYGKGNSFDEICNWITANIGDRVKENYFIRAFMTSVLEDSIVHKKLRWEKLDNHYSLMQRFVTCDVKPQLQCLYAVHTLVNNLEHPQGLLLSLFDKMYECSIISREAFNEWEKSDDPAESLNKGVALMQLAAFFNNINEGDESSEEA